MGSRGLRPKVGPAPVPAGLLSQDFLSPTNFELLKDWGQQSTSLQPTRVHSRSEITDEKQQILKKTFLFKSDRPHHRVEVDPQLSYLN